MNLIIAMAGTFLYHGAYFSGSNGAGLCDLELSQTLSRMEQVGVHAITGSCAPIRDGVSPNVGFEVQILVAGFSGNIQRYDYELTTPCAVARERLRAGATQHAVPWIAAFCDDRGLHADFFGKLETRINWDLLLGTFSTKTGCETRATEVHDRLADHNQSLFFWDCAPISDVNQRLQYRLRLTTQGPASAWLGLYEELAYDSPTACEVGAVDVDAALEAQQMATGVHQCESVRSGMIARHLVLDRNPSRISRQNGPAYATELQCRDAYPAVWQFLESEQNVPFTYRCISQNESYRLFIDYLRAPPRLANTPEGSLPPQQ